MWNGNIKCDEFELDITCNDCSICRTYDAYVERDNDSAYVEIYISNKKEVFNNIDVDRDRLEINGSIICPDCGCEIKVNKKIKYNYK